MTSSHLAGPVVELVRRHDPDRFLACLFAPPERREAALVVCAFNHELARAREVVSHPTLALIRLQWWREVVEGERRRHEVAEPVRAFLDSGALSAADLLEMIAGREAEAYEPIADLGGWLDYLDLAFGAVAVAMGRALGADEGECARLRNVGSGYGAVGVMLGVSALARQGRCLLPDDVLGAHGLTRDHVLHDPRVAVPVLDALSEHAARLLEAGAGPYRRLVVAAALPGVLARRDLARRDRVRPDRLRGIGDKLAVLRAGLTGRP